ncbi:3,4-dihydroxyphenylacetate 2,3-dioxygenase protein (plasmid) [Rhizobium etli bv. mimosae str. IE4771]|uniref:3,4-dihydroxyphenylacetate 2,3-dioxygenase protein n=1 Tax=Rhizobium etli bv. mimosae str. IE4771 TaxID=1432050 RepID=A0A060IAK6_RHIET|nr:VOC family protein [Rhizobium sp. IE4771]AIC30709.1 3,4-dihydroxyphenylacetate 2,3-dioxygenase protein [Rhizobium sp. IE4771]
MKFPDTNYNPPFNITRASHLTLTVKDLGRSKEFYTEVFGLVVSDEDSETIFLRGVEEVAHHSLVLHKTVDAPRCQSIGMRVQFDEDLDRAKAHFDGEGIRSEWIEVPFQARTLRFHDCAGTPVDLVARMETRQRLLGQSRLHKGGAVLRLDHYQLHTPDPHEASIYYSNLGFRCSDYNVGGTPERITGAFMSRKDNPHDIVYIRGRGPALHHFAYAIMESSHIFRACDAAAQLGFGQTVERGPQRHGLDHMLYVYFRDPDGHRAEIFIMPIQLIDLEEPPHEWGTIGTLEQPWGRPAPRSWFFETTPFENVELSPRLEEWEPMTLEKSLGL